MNVHILGSCSGTEPFLNRHQTSIWLETGNKNYLFDAGENCSYTACMMGLDPLKLNGIFISHPHIDHTGGLPHLLWTIRKLTGVRKQNPEVGTLPVFTPDIALFDAILNLLRATGENIVCGFELKPEPIHDGEIFHDGNIRVEACHNLHLGKPADGISWKSYSYRIHAEGKKIVFSGDIKSLDDIGPYLSDGCDLLLTETGHHHPWEIAEELLTKKYAIGELVFLHHGRDFLCRPEESIKKTAAVWKRNFTVAEDRQTIKL